MRRFLLIGSRAQKQGKINLNDLAGAAGTVDPPPYTILVGDPALHPFPAPP